MIEILAYSLMFFDHIAKFLKMNIQNFNPIISRLSFPFFAYMTARSLRITKNKDKYLKRLFIFALVSQIPYILMIFGIPNIENISRLHEKIIYIITFFTQNLNIGFTILLGSLAINMINNNKDNLLNKILFLTIFLLIAQIANVDYGAYGVSLIVMFYFVKTLPNLIMYTALLNGLNILFIGMYEKINKIDKFNTNVNTRNIIGILAIPIIYFLGIKYENKIKEKINKKNISIKEKRKKEKILKLIKYSIYPLHMLIIFILNFTNAFV